MLIDIDMIEAGTRLRGTTPEQVASLAESIAEVGLISPIAVYPRSVIRQNVAQDGYGLIAGLHRLEACRSLGLVQIEATVVEVSELQRQLAECDENLCGTKLTPSERALFTRRRKEIYEALHPETRNGINQHSRVRQVGEPSERFTADTATKTGQSERAIQRDATRGERIDGAVLDAIQGTEFDRGVVLDELASVPRDAQADKLAEIRRRKDDREIIRKAGDAIVSHDAHDDAAAIIVDNVPYDVRQTLVGHLGAVGATKLVKAIRRAEQELAGPRERDVNLFDQTAAGRG
jgi:uncharacterized ParB-like nuclease family protein